ncbi:MAG: 3-phosphoshikimate 1-carboxyvinyltransferase [Elusimicrobiales bacterium]|jgi:3-phosphoshikimate 1-carboxyvinyltransferase
MTNDLNRSYTPPPDKSVTHRALILAAVADGSTVISNPSDCADTASTASCLKKLGVKISPSRGGLTVKGAGLRGLRAPSGPLNAGESGTTLRLLAGLLAGQEFDSVLTGTGTLLNRPMDRVSGPLSAMGARIKTRGGRPPLQIRGSALSGADHRLEIPSAQVKSAILLAGLYAEGPTSITERLSTRDHTERLLKYLGARISSGGPNLYLRPGRFNSRNIKVPGDISSAAPFITTACLLPGFTLSIKGVGLNPGRMGLISALKAMGARITVKPAAACNEPEGELVVRGAALKGVRIRPDEVPAMIDELPLLALAASRAVGSTVINGVGELRHKESDRLKATLALFKTLGLRAETGKDSLIIRGGQKISGGRPAETFNDHRIAMAAAAAGRLAARPVKIKDPFCVKKSYPDFFADFKKVFY